MTCENPRTAARLVEATLRSWLGANAGVAAAPADGSHPLDAAEENFVAKAVPRRREEFSTGRWCARRALAEIGAPPQAISAGPLGEPRWPEGAIGSITHAAGICAAVAARAGAWRAVGIDVAAVTEVARLSATAAALIANPAEVAEVRHGMTAPEDALAVLFSARESVIKAVSPRAARFVDFHEVAIQIGPAAFEANCCGLAVSGWWRVADGLAITAAVLAG